MVLVPFDVTTKCTNKVSSVERRKLDAQLDQAMEKAAEAATIVVQLLKNIDESKVEEIMKKMENVFPSCGPALQRLIVSYSWQIYATYEVHKRLFCNNFSQKQY